MSQGYPSVPPPASPGNGMAVASLVVGLVGLLLAVVTGWIPCVGLFIPLIPTSLAVIFGFVGRSKAGQGAPHGGLAAAGLACGLLGLVFTIGFQAFYGIMAKKAFDEAGGIEGMQQNIEKAGKEFEAEMKRIGDELDKEQEKFELQIDDEKQPATEQPTDPAPDKPLAPDEPEAPPGTQESTPKPCTIT